ncbi:acetate--CoA ligase family protein [Epidermidibacterium keratini]
MGLTARPLQLLRQHGYAGRIHPVNPRYDEIDGLPCSPTIAAIPGGVDLVLSLVPAAHTVDVIEDAAQAGAKVVVVFASGFAETGPAGARLQNDIEAAARRSGIRIVGPNCQGLIHVPTGFFGTFTAAAGRDMHGTSGVAYVGQSGAIGGSVLDLSAEMGLSLTAWASTGNQADLDLVEVAESMLSDDDINVVLMYAEGISDGARFVRIAQRAAQRNKRLVLLRSGRSTSGKRAAASHTGAMLGDDQALVAASQRYNVILVDDVDEMLAVGAVLATAAPLTGNRLGIVTTSGGAGILLTDQLAVRGLEVPPLSEESSTELKEFVPDFGAVSNPVDVTAQVLSSPTAMPDFAEVCRIAAADEHVDGLAIVLTMVTGERALNLAHTLVNVARHRTDKPTWIIWLASREQTTGAREVLRAAGIPVFDSAGDLARTLAQVTPPALFQSDSAVSNTRAAEVLLNERPGQLEALFDALAISRAEPRLARTPDDAARIATELATPVAMKIHAKSVIHKSDVGGVRLNVEASTAGRTFDELVATAHTHAINDLEGVDVEPMARPGIELVVGATASGDGYPAVVSVGFGGVTTEIFRDIAAIAAPIDETQARQLLTRLTAWPLLNGFRGTPPADVAAAAAAISAVSAMAHAAEGRAFEFEINPLIVHADRQGVTAVDALIRVRRDEQLAS